MKNNLENQDIKTDKPLPMSYEALKAERDAQQKRADALRVMPADWFRPHSLYINRPEYRCERLLAAGVLDTRVIGEYPDLVRQYRKKEAQHG
ncbi:TPA: hypothetical protein SMF89_000992 [Serratia marcescens]|jgi:hypothetical protein|nr:hypothetical protein [Serratia marcescens]